VQVVVVKDMPSNCPPGRDRKAGSQARDRVVARCKHHGDSIEQGPVGKCEIVSRRLQIVCPLGECDRDWCHRPPYR
jgi:hypothetical protein